MKLKNETELLKLAEEQLLLPAGLTEQQIQKILGNILGKPIDAADLYFQSICSESWVLEDGIVKEVAFWGGCNGNLQGLSRLVKGMPVDAVIARLEGIRCGRRSTSCPDQLCKALHEMGY